MCIHQAAFFKYALHSRFVTFLTCGFVCVPEQYNRVALLLKFMNELYHVPNCVFSWVVIEFLSA
jgi:hypothetical protein